MGIQTNDEKVARVMAVLRQKSNLDRLSGGLDSGDAMLKDVEEFAREHNVATTLKPLFDDFKAVSKLGRGIESAMKTQLKSDMEEATAILVGAQ